MEQNFKYPFVSFLHQCVTDFFEKKSDFIFDKVNSKHLAVSFLLNYVDEEVRKNEDNDEFIYPDDWIRLEWFEDKIKLISYEIQGINEFKNRIFKMLPTLDKETPE